jgi:hypothetical protein
MGEKVTVGGRIKASRQMPSKHGQSPRSNQGNGQGELRDIMDRQAFPIEFPKAGSLLFRSSLHGRLRLHIPASTSVRFPNSHLPEPKPIADFTFGYDPDWGYASHPVDPFGFPCDQEIKPNKDID